MEDSANKMISYDHRRNKHTLEGATTALPLLLEGLDVNSLLDVGCGTGVWMRAALDQGIDTVYGVDGILVENSLRHVPQELISKQNLEEKWDLGQHFDIALCLEVAEHLPAASAASLVTCITRHANTIFFSAAMEWQEGQHHVNCQWPAYWQSLFNKEGFICNDQVRWRIWNVSAIEPWYRQNMFMATRNLEQAGTEPRLVGVIHPDLMLPICERWRRSHESLVVAMANRASSSLRRLLTGKPA